MNDSSMHSLRRARNRVGLTQKQLADFTQVGKSTIERAEAGKPVRAYNIQQICSYFSERYHRQVEPEELGLVYEEEESQKTNDAPYEDQRGTVSEQLTENGRIMNRHDLIQELIALGFTILMAPHQLRDHQPVIYVPEVSLLSGTHESSLSFFENDLATRWDLYYTGGPVRAERGLDLSIREIAKLARLAEGAGWHQRALRLLTMGYQLQTCIRRDMMKYDQAHLAYQRAFHVAQELEEPELIASALAREGVTLIQQEKPKEAIIYLDGALNLIDGRNFPTLKGHVFQALAEAYAKAKQSQACWQSMGQAEQILAHQEQTQEQSLVRFNAASFAAQKGVNAVLLGDYERAVELIDESLRTYDPALIRGRARLIAQKAEALYGDGLVDASVATAEEAWALANSVGANKTIARVKILHTTLLQSPWRKEQSVARFGAKLTTP